MNIIKQWEDYRIIEVVDTDCTLDDLKGDCYNIEINESETLTKEMILSQEKHFELLVETEGVFGYILEKWCPDIDQGWQHVDSCFGFVGAYDPNNDDFNHYIVSELEQGVLNEIS